MRSDLGFICLVLHGVLQQNRKSQNHVVVLNENYRFEEKQTKHKSAYS